MKRFFSFGCSFTHYIWPTWADILGKQYDYYENWGRMGVGNFYILNSLVECHLKNQITRDDVIGIMWTNIHRIDTYKNEKWISSGNVHSDLKSFKHFKPFIDTRGFYVRDLSFIYLAEQLLENIGCKYFMCSMLDIKNFFQSSINIEDSFEKIDDILPYYKNTLDKIKPSVHQIIFNYDWTSRPFQSISGHVRLDPHPSPAEHLEYLDKIFPEYLISPDTREFIKEINDKLQIGDNIENLLVKYDFKKTPPKRW